MSQISVTTGQALSGRVKKDMFGGNMLFDRDRFDNGTFDDAIDDLNITNLRYPGGSIAEWYFDINNPDATEFFDPMRGEMRQLMPLSDYMAAIAEMGIPTAIVLPTAPLLGDGPLGARSLRPEAAQEVYDFATKLIRGDFGSGEVGSIEIGNEYWLGGAMNHIEYALVADMVSQTLQRAFDDYAASGSAPAGWDDPDIVVQIGQYGQFSTSPGWIQNDIIIDSMSDGAAAAIDAAVVHYYTRGSFKDLPTHGYYFDRLDTWANDPRFSGIDYHVTEWNMDNYLSDEQGLRATSTLVYMFSEMVARGVDAAHVWPVQQNNQSNLARNETQDELALPGEAFRMMSESLMWKELTWRHETGTTSTHVYEGTHETIVFVGSRSLSEQQISLDLDFLGRGVEAIWSTTLTTDGPVGQHSATPRVEITGAYQNWGDSLTFDLGAFELVRLTFTHRAPGNPNDLAMVGTGFNDRIEGTLYNDRIEAGSGEDLILSSWGDDRIEAGAGNDTIYGGGQSDWINAGSGNDIVYGGKGRDTVYLGEGNDTFHDERQSGHFGIDVVYGGTGADTVHGGGGEDRIYGEAGQDLLYGGDEHDIIDGGVDEDTLFGGSGDDQLFGGAGNDHLHGQTGRDILDGGAGADWLTGGKGNDTYIVDNLGDRIVEIASQGTDTVQSSVDFVLRDHSQHLEHLTLTGAGDTLGIGNEKRNTITGNSGDNWLNGAWNDDTLIGGAGNDTFNDDRGSDRMIGGTGNDTYFVDDGGDQITELASEGFDVVHSEVSFALRAHSQHIEDLYLMGSAAISAVGNGMNNRIEGNRGDNLIVGAMGDDTLIGGDGADTFAFYLQHGDDVIEDFVAGEDKLLFGNNTALSDLSIEAIGADLEILYGHSDRLLLEGHGSTSLSEIEFIFA